MLPLTLKSERSLKEVFSLSEEHSEILRRQHGQRDTFVATNLTFVQARRTRNRIQASIP